MLQNLALKLAMTFMIIAGAFYFWYTTEGEATIGEDVKENLTKLIPVNVSSLLGAAGLGEEGYCPFINPYMSELFSTGSMVTAPDTSPTSTHSAFEYVIDYECGVGITIDYDYEVNEYILECPTRTGTGGYASLTANELAERLNDHAVENNLPMSLKEGFLVKGWQCYLFFGILPFIAMFLFLKDILGFAMLSPRIKFMISGFSAIVAVYTGTFAKFLWQLSYLAAISIQGTFLIVMLFLGFISIIMSWIGTIGAAVGESREEAAEVAAGMAQKLSQKALSDVFSKKGKD